MIRVVLADDEAMIRAGVRAVLASDPAIEVVAEAGDGRTAIDAARKHQPDVVVLDIRMPGLDGLSSAAELRQVLPGVAVVVLTTFDEDAYVAQALECGVSGFLLKASDPRELLIALHAVAEGAAYLSPRIARRLITRVRGEGLSRSASARTRVGELTPRERDVLAALGSGLSNADIGRALFLSEGTVKAHVSAILRRLGLANRVKAAILAHEAGLVADDH
ncbi:response regulator [Saccharomonospora xinjiangensis]|uniref:Response regulator containing a CheY-like receiver domain and an HTH DNA-binding domain n=1 Tax=Saccharomonospora xinjiangensis XJ-54 TaxID=882086 RepID=I0V7B8_9PSEU|nr:response regulator transcription factor [Saccharomonospora xinjiangensis]EID56021.1 response regulator containing a CheY-like receiver domain and an HTH DNA-binding domain [Saccharomonospora xinjiangensis XJ-54]